MPMTTKSMMAAMASHGIFLDMFIVRPDDRLTTWCHNTQLRPWLQIVSTTC
jgi:hypothetical protein